MQSNTFFVFLLFFKEEDDVLFEKGKVVFSVGALIYQMSNLYRRDIEKRTDI